MTHFPLESYPLADNGTAFVFSYDKFENKSLSERKGNEKDLEALKRSLPKLGFKRIEIFRNQRQTSSLDKLKEIASSKVESEHRNCLLIIFLSHGSLGEVQTCDGSVTLKQIMERFCLKGLNCWSGIPKVFLFQVCRASKSDMRTEEDDYDGEEESIVEEMADNSSYDVPCGSDIFMGFATSPGFVSRRSRTNGSRYIQTFATIVGDYTENEKKREDIDFVHLMMCVTSEVRQINTIDWHLILTDKAKGTITSKISTNELKSSNQIIKQTESKNTSQKTNCQARQLPWCSTTFAKMLKFPKCPNIDQNKLKDIIIDEPKNNQTRPKSDEIENNQKGNSSKENTNTEEQSHKLDTSRTFT